MEDDRRDHVPEAGLFLWAFLGEGVSSMQTADRMLELGHVIAPSNALLSGLQDTQNIRINIAGSFRKLHAADAGQAARADKANLAFAARALQSYFSSEVSWMPMSTRVFAANSRAGPSRSRKATCG